MSWLDGVAGSGFGLDHLPLGIFSDGAGGPRPGAALGTRIVDLAALVRAGRLDEPAFLGAPSLNAFLAAGRRRWHATRCRLQAIFAAGAAADDRSAGEAALVERAGARLHLPIAPGDFVDFYSSIEHATNVGRLFRPAEPLLPNYRHLPIGYHGRAGTVVVDGTPVVRPHGQTVAAGSAEPGFGPSAQLDYELELGFVTGSGPPRGTPIPIGEAREYIYGFVLLNDWSARDIQSWEYQPLGPFAGKSFATSIGPWLVSLDALAPFAVANRVLAPEPLPYLRTAEPWAYDIALEVGVRTERMRSVGAPPERVAATNFRDMYWHAAQQLAHVTANGNAVRAGDLYGSGTISGSEPGSFGSLLETTLRGTRPFVFANGETRAFLADGDTVVMRGHAGRGDERIDFGEVRGTIVA